MPLAGAALGHDPQCFWPLSWVLLLGARVLSVEMEEVTSEAEDRIARWKKGHLEVGAMLRRLKEAALRGTREGKTSEGVKKIQSAFQICPVSKGKGQADADLVTAVLERAVRTGRGIRGNIYF